MRERETDQVLPTWMEPADPADLKPVLCWTFQLSPFAMGVQDHMIPPVPGTGSGTEPALHECRMNDGCISPITLVRESLSWSVYPYLEHNFPLGVLNY